MERGRGIGTAKTVPTRLPQFDRVDAAVKNACSVYCCIALDPHIILEIDHPVDDGDKRGFAAARGSHEAGDRIFLDFNGDILQHRCIAERDPQFVCCYLCFHQSL